MLNSKLKQFKVKIFQLKGKFKAHKNLKFEVEFKINKSKVQNLNSSLKLKKGPKLDDVFEVKFKIWESVGVTEIL